MFNAVRRWSTRECKRQRLELTSENRRRVLEGAQYLVRYFIIPKEDFKAGPYKSGLLSSEEAEAVLTNLGLHDFGCGVQIWLYKIRMILPLKTTRFKEHFEMEEC